MTFRTFLFAAMAVTAAVAQAPPVTPAPIPEGPAWRFRVPPDVRIVEFRLHSAGISPASVTVPEGNILIYVQNPFYGDDLPFVLDDPRSARVAAGSVAKGQSRGRLLTLLRPGNHTLSIPGVPGVRARIIVSPAQSAR